MKQIFLQANILIKNTVLFLRPHLYLRWAKSFLLLMGYTIEVSDWIETHNKKNQFNDFFTFKRQYNKRESLYDHVIQQYQLQDEPIEYLEFGVSRGDSFKWWVNRLVHSENRFYGFDTFEGLPEEWGGHYEKGDMAASIPNLNDERTFFYKGLFQDTLFPFLKSDVLKTKRRKIIHMDADIFSATLFVLTSIYPYLNPGDILFFDEFNVPKHEFLAFKIFADSFYLKYEVLGSVNNYLQTAIIIK